jgi:hypothetical protein
VKSFFLSEKYELLLNYLNFPATMPHSDCEVIAASTNVRNKKTNKNLAGKLTGGKNQIFCWFFDAGDFLILKLIIVTKINCR